MIHTMASTSPRCTSTPPPSRGSGVADFSESIEIVQLYQLRTAAGRVVTIDEAAVARATVLLESAQDVSPALLPVAAGGIVSYIIIVAHTSPVQQAGHCSVCEPAAVLSTTWWSRPMQRRCNVMAMCSTVLASVVARRSKL